MFNTTQFSPSKTHGAILQSPTRPLRQLRQKTAAACVAAALLVLAGCASIPPGQPALPQQDLARLELPKDIKLASEGWPEASWWTAYGDPQLDALIKQALAGSPSLAVAATRIGVAQSSLAYDKADAGVNVGLAASANRQRYSSNGLFPAPIGGSYYSEETVQLQAHYEFDWWGKRRAQIAAALGEVNASRADYAMAEQTLSAEVARSYFTLQTDWARLQNFQRLGDILQTLVDDKNKRIAHGIGATDQLLSAEAELTYLQQTVAALAAHAQREREALRALVGGDANALADLKPVAEPNISHGLPGKLGLELLARRPDLQAARWRVEASLSRIEASKAAFYPDIDLTGSIGLDTVKLGNLAKSGSRTVFLGPALSLPLFDSHRLDANLGSARSERDELIADYNQSVVNVVRDVAQAGSDLQGLQQEIIHQGGTLAATTAMLRNAQARFDRGLADRSTPLGYEANMLVQQDARLQLQAKQLLAEVTLVKALGGGYKTDPQAAPQGQAPAVATAAPATAQQTQ